MNLIRKEKEVKGITAKISINDVTGSTENIKTIITGYTTDIGITYYDIPTFISVSKMSDKTIRRRISFAEKFKDKWRYVICPDGNKLYVSFGLANIKKFSLNKKIQNEYVNFLKAYSWSIKGTLRPEFCPTPEASRKSAESFYKALSNNFKDSRIIYWYVTEKKPNNDGYHIHYVIGSPDVNFETLNSWINKYIGVYNTSNKQNKRLTNSNIGKYDINGNWLEYVTKQMEMLPDAYGWMDSGLD